MQIESIEIKNYRLFRHAKLSHIARLCVLVGANGTGKSTLFDVFLFLKDALGLCGRTHCADLAVSAGNYGQRAAGDLPAAARA